MAPSTMRLPPRGRAPGACRRRPSGRPGRLRAGLRHQVPHYVGGAGRRELPVRGEPVPQCGADGQIIREPFDDDPLVPPARQRRDDLVEGRLTLRDLLAPLYAWFTEGFDTPDLQEAKPLLEAVGAPIASEQLLKDFHNCA